jgi:hypothetical protein
VAGAVVTAGSGVAVERGVASPRGVAVARGRWVGTGLSAGPGEADAPGGTDVPGEAGGTRPVRPHALITSNNARRAAMERSLVITEPFPHRRPRGWAPGTQSSRASSVRPIGIPWLEPPGLTSA